MNNSTFVIPKKLIKDLPILENSLDYDYQIYVLSFNFEDHNFIAINPLFDQNEILDYINIQGEPTKFTIWKDKNDIWLAKYFTKNWIPSRFSYNEIVIDFNVDNRVWKINPDLDQTMTFKNDIFKQHKTDLWDRKYRLIWYLDPRVNPTKDKIWAFSSEPSTGEIEGNKNMGFVMPDIEVIFNKHLPVTNINPDNHYPPFWELEFENVYYLDPIFKAEKDTWILKFIPNYRHHEGWRSMGNLSPKMNVEYNPVLGELDYDIDYQIPWYDLEYEHVWLLDRKFMHDGEKDIWAFKISYSNNPTGTKIVGYISPKLFVEYNKLLPNLDYNIDYNVFWHDINFKHMWMLDRQHIVHGEEDIWALKIFYSKKSFGTKLIGYTTPKIYIDYNDEIKNIDKKVNYNIPWYELNYEHIFTLDDQSFEENIWVTSFRATDNPVGKKYVGKIKPLIKNLDVIFISYNESNAEENWKRVLQKAPWAKRVNGVKGIFNAHKAAAKLSTSDMFYVVDGDAYLVDDWNFDFQPNIFDRDCAYVWSSKNPINDLIYGYGGVKLFPKKILLSKRTWKTLDMFSCMPKIKVEKKISCITKFNVDEFSTWRSAFRECVKLYINGKRNEINEWLTKGKSRKFGKFSMKGAEHAIQFARKYQIDEDMLLKINDYDWLKVQFNKSIKK